MPSYNGSCLCGQVRFQITPPLKTFQYCHCSRCRKASGSAHVSNIFVPVEGFEWLEGAEHARRWEMPEAQYFCTSFCTRCGSNLPWVTRNGKMVVVPAGALNDDPEIRPTRSVFFGSRAPWYVHAAELPQFETFPGDSR